MLDSGIHRWRYQSHPVEAKGVTEAGYGTGIILMLEATRLFKDPIAAQVQGIGVPPLKELMDFLVAHNVRISV